MEMQTERSLSENKKFLTKEKSTLSLQTLIGPKLTKDAIIALGHGDPNEVPISRQMLKRCKGACTEYEREIIGSDNGLLPDGTKPLPEPMLTYHH